jgi:phosphoribosyl-dephospho-CoA transferase
MPGEAAYNNVSLREELVTREPRQSFQIAATEKQPLTLTSVFISYAGPSKALQQVEGFQAHRNSVQ